LSRRRNQVVASLFGLVLAAQLVRPDRTNPPIDPGRTIRAQPGSTAALVAVLDRSCGDCHSNGTVWRWYAKIAPLSWLMASGVREGRKVVNFSEWTAYPPEQRRALLVASCRAARAGSMPGAYAWLRPETRLSPLDVETICAASRSADSGGHSDDGSTRSEG
jgi:hypothetical protein